jgi:hypothetical protein
MTNAAATKPADRSTIKAQLANARYLAAEAIFRTNTVINTATNSKAK